MSDVSTVIPSLPGFDAAVFAQAGAPGEPALLAAKRAQAFAATRTLAPPTARDEEWRRTDPERFPFAQFQRLPALPARPAGAADDWDDTFDVVVEISDTGYAISDRTGVVRDGKCAVFPLAEAADRFPAVIQDHLLGRAQPAQPRLLSMVSGAFWNVGFLVHVPAQVRIEKGILIRYDVQRSGGALLPRILFVAEAGAEVSVVEHFTSAPDAEFLCLGGREFYAGPGAKLKLVAVQEWGDRALHLGEDWARVEQDGRVDWVTLSLGGRASKLMVGSDVCAPRAHAQLSGVFFADRDQHFDQRTLQLHTSPHTTSYLLYKGAVKDTGRSVYQGVINAKPGAIDVDAYQMNNNLILNEGARADSLPGLEIDADDLKCSHGSTMGTLDPEQLFYLQSRGLPAAEARRLVVAGFFEEVIAQIPHAFVQERLREHIQLKMGGGA